MDSAQQRYLPLDGLRALAIIAVFCFHYRLLPHSPAEWGWAGVDLFFALSGYLITGILYDTLDAPHYFRNFYMRRALRIFPLYWGLWIVLLALTLFLYGPFDPWYLAWPAYFGNFLSAHALHLGLKPTHYEMLPFRVHFVGEKFAARVGPYWSLAVEEQYYLVWPLVIHLLRRRTTLLAFCIGAMAGILALRMAMLHFEPASWNRNNLVYFFTFTRADALFAGSVLALLARGPRGIAGLPVRFILTLTTFAFCALALSTWQWGIFHGVTFAPWMQTYGLTLIAIAAAGVLTAALRIAWFARALAWKPLVQLGAVSYGFYVLHLLFYDCDRIPADATRGIIPPELIHAGIFAFIWLLAWLSFRFYETPFLRLKHRWGSNASVPTVEPSPSSFPQPAEHAAD